MGFSMVLRCCFVACALLVTVSGLGLLDSQLEPARLVNRTGIPVNISPADDVHLSTTERLIFGKTASSIKNFPYVVGLFAKVAGVEIFLCTGIIVDKRVILTAAHCLNDFISDSQYRVCYASANLVNQKLRKCTTIVAKKVQNSFKSEETTGPFDFALLKTKGKIRSNRTAIARLDFRTSTTTKSKRLGFSVGFGQTPSGWDGKLRFLPVTHGLCGDIDNNKYFRCTSSNRQDGSGGLCSGDSGGPLIEGRISVPHTQRVIGILSWTLQVPGSPAPCSELGGGYSRLSRRDHQKFLQKAIKELGGRFKTA
ncbi:hypothetical protein NDN08_007619 [Rhodosorus marinus]|uniref:Peptidase S1 domain-containing protein n=1 Tax=Rhodosorus marinus TaxID=101924 RepID=A0AAV8V275_9RHOD|nr:hypothetical protein NDN08_007619 [Rhodosorus marinus]